MGINSGQSIGAAFLGATKLVVGRPITTKPDPVKAMLQIVEDIGRGLADRQAAEQRGVA
jgi:orotidine-5'-phosphate decarboxylase